MFTNKKLHSSVNLQKHVNDTVYNKGKNATMASALLLLELNVTAHKMIKNRTQG